MRRERLLYVFRTKWMHAIRDTLCNQYPHIIIQYKHHDTCWFYIFSTLCWFWYQSALGVEKWKCAWARYVALRGILYADDIATLEDVSLDNSNAHQNEWQWSSDWYNNDKSGKRSLNFQIIVSELMGKLQHSFQNHSILIYTLPCFDENEIKFK